MKKKKQEKYFIVEKIIDKKRAGHITKYLIKWEGYSHNENTWEPLYNLMHIRGMVYDFNKNLYKKKQQDVKQDQNKDGSFDFNDKVKKIINSHKFVDQKWEKRECGFQPQNSLMNYQQLKYNCSDILLDYIEKQLKI